MKTRYLGIGIALLATLTVQLSGADLTSLGYSVISQQQEGSRTVYEAEDDAGNRFSLSAAGELSNESAEAIRRILTEFYNWSTMEISYLRITANETDATALIVPSEYAYEGTDLTPFLPSGIQFYVGRFVEYDFRIRVENIFVRLRGQLTNEKQFTERLANAIEDPAGFIERNDPEYVLRELRDIEDRLTELQLAKEELDTRIETFREDFRTVDTAIRADLAQTVSALERLEAEVSETYRVAVSAFTELRADYLATKDEASRIAADYLETKAAHETLAEAFGLLAEDYEKLKEDTATVFERQAETNSLLAEQIALLRYAFIAEANESFFGKLRPVSMEAATRIVAVATASPELSAKEIASLLKDEGFDVSKKGVSFVLLAYLGIETE